jgi:hypothetical protein
LQNSLKQLEFKLQFIKKEKTEVYEVLNFKSLKVRILVYVIKIMQINFQVFIKRFYMTSIIVNDTFCNKQITLSILVHKNTLSQYFIFIIEIGFCQ